MNTQTITSFIRNPLSFFVSDIIEDIEADFAPQLHDIVLFRDEKGEWKHGSFQGLWSDIRPLRFFGDDRLTNIEESPYHGDTTIRAKINYASKNEAGEWIIEFMHSYPSVNDVLPPTLDNLEYALLSNQAHANSVAKDLAVA